MHSRLFLKSAQTTLLKFHTHRTSSIKFVIIFDVCNVSFFAIFAACLMDCCGLLLWDGDQFRKQSWHCLIRINFHLTNTEKLTEKINCCSISYIGNHAHLFFSLEKKTLTVLSRSRQLLALIVSWIELNRLMTTTRLIVALFLTHVIAPLHVGAKTGQTLDAILLSASDSVTKARHHH